MPRKSAPPSEIPLTFQWEEPPRQTRKLGFWLFIVVVALTAFFYLFQVVYPQTQRFTPVPQQVLVLNPADPAAMALLNRVQDRDYLLLPSDNHPAGAPTIQEYSPVFHPTFEKHELRVQDLPYKAFTVPPARLLRVEDPVLPPLDLGELAPLPPASSDDGGGKPPEAQLTARLTGPLAQRKLLSSPVLEGVALASPESCRFQMAVDAAGRVEFLLPVHFSDTPEVPPQMAAQVLAQLQDFRFEPLSADETPAPAPKPSPIKGSNAKANANATAKRGTQAATPTVPTWGSVTLYWKEPEAP